MTRKDQDQAQRDARTSFYVMLMVLGIYVLLMTGMGVAHVQTLTIR